MRAFLVDDEQHCLEELRWSSENPDIEIVLTETDPLAALEVPGEKTDAVFWTLTCLG